MQTIEQVPIQKDCEPVAVFSQEYTHQEVANSMMRDALGNSSAPDISYLDEEIAAIEASPLYKKPGQAEQQTVAIEANRPLIERGEEARVTQVAFGCGACALSTTCAVKANLDAHINNGRKATKLVDRLSETRQTNERIFPLVEGFGRWSTNNEVLKSQGNRDMQRPEIIKRIKENNKIHERYMTTLMSMGTMEERDAELEVVYQHLSKDLQEKFVKDGFVDGIVTELFVYEQLKDVAESVGAKAELSSVDEDVEDGYDIKLTLENGRVIYIDAKSKMPSDADTKNSMSDYFGKKYGTTRNGKTIYVVCPTPPKPGMSYLGTRQLGEQPRRSYSFANQPAREPEVPFTDLVKRAFGLRQKVAA